ncbi:MAG TPA: class I SAM-dependent methyltransferase [Polyangiaceae bacterium]|jgi:SAM-dependent methyltransferase
MKPGRGVDRELEAGSRAHYEDAVYYASLYKRRIDDVQFYVGLAQRFEKAGPVLEYGIGNGRVALPIARHGRSVVGIDHSRAMLSDLKGRLASEPDAVRRRVQGRFGDMRKKRLGRRFPLVICPFNAALHLYTRPDVEQFLARVRGHLAPGGQFVCDLSVPMFEDLMRDPARAYKAPRFKYPTTGEVVSYVEHFDYDRARQVLFVSMDFEPQGHPERGWMTPLAHRQFFPQEWEALLHYNGFEVEKVEGDFHGGPLDRTSDVMVWYARARRGWSRR